MFGTKQCTTESNDVVTKRLKRPAIRTQMHFAQRYLDSVLTLIHTQVKQATEWRIHMEAKLFGVPLVIWGVVCIVFTIVWVVIWPSDKVTSIDGVRYVILRWFHALTWLLLALAAFLAAFNWLGGTQTARAVALLSLSVYLIFMGTFVFTR